MSNSQQSFEPPCYDPDPNAIVDETPPFVLTPAAPVILSWAGESSSNLDDAGVPGGTTRLDGEPPDYEASTKPTEHVTYSFSSSSFNTTLVIPPPSAANTSPKYFISTHLNCLSPGSFITVVKRGANENGEYVGEFEMGGLPYAGTVCIKTESGAVREFRIQDALRHGWDFNSFGLIWSDSLGSQKNVQLIKCYKKSKRGLPLAVFYPRQALQSGGTRYDNDEKRIPTLQVSPSGHDVFDHIILSLLVHERVRLSAANQRGAINDGLYFATAFSPSFGSS